MAPPACREPIATLNRGDPASAEVLFSAIRARVSDPLRDPKYDSARVRIAAAAFLPSRVWSDTSVWTSSADSTRTLLVGGRFAEGRYRLTAEPEVPPPHAMGDARHAITLARLSNDEYSWDTDVIYALGTVRAADIARFLNGLFTAVDERDGGELRADYRALIPLGSAVLGQLFQLDTIVTVRLADGSTLATFAARLTPRGVERRYPHFARYLERYASSARAEFSLRGRGADSARYIEMAADEGRLSLRLRTRAGRLVALRGAPLPLPDSLTLEGGLRLRVHHFTIGFHDYHAEFSLTRSAQERAWTVVSRAEPEWNLPFVAERLLRSPLRRPFQGRGALFRIGVRDSAGAPTLLFRRMYLEVRESLILRFIGRLGAMAVGDYTGLAEREQYAWLHEVFNALLTDVKSMP